MGDKTRSLGIKPLSYPRRTSYQRRFKSTSNPSLVEFAEKVHYRLHGTHNITKRDPSYQTGLWLGRDTERGEHLIATAYSVVKARSIRRYSTDERFDLQLLKSLHSVTGTVSTDQYCGDEPVPVPSQGFTSGEEASTPPLTERIRFAEGVPIPPPPGLTHPDDELPQHAPLPQGQQQLPGPDPAVPLRPPVQRSRVHS